VLARGEISLDVSDQGVRVRYYDHHFPIDPTTLPDELEIAMRDPSTRDVVRRWTEGDQGQARLRELLARQHYELAFWRTAQRDLNYRRFFDVNELIALRVEREEVFEATHKTVLRFVADGLVDGLRIDHIDGLLEPRRYLERLRATVDARRPAACASITSMDCSNRGGISSDCVRPSTRGDPLRQELRAFRFSSRRSSRRTRRFPKRGRWTARPATSS
jgi:maltooligosyltrehalose synthase